MTVCSCPEDGPRCRQGVKAPLKLKLKLPPPSRPLQDVNICQYLGHAGEKMSTLDISMILYFTLYAVKEIVESVASSQMLILLEG